MADPAPPVPPLLTPADKIVRSAGPPRRHLAIGQPDGGAAGAMGHDLSVVIRLLSPSDYGLFAMTGVVMAFMSMLNGYGLASGLVRQPDVDARMIRQLFGMLILLNAGLALAQVTLAPLCRR
ncbi:oligosaccharide flippase family protein [Sphingomonas sp. MMS24-JH45]